MGANPDPTETLRKTSALNSVGGSPPVKPLQDGPIVYTPTESTRRIIPWAFLQAKLPRQSLVTAATDRQNETLVGDYQMSISNDATDARNVGGERMTREPSLLIDVNDLAAMLQCSPRHVWRMADAGKMPRPYKIGALCRWDRAAIESWIADGCPNCRTGVRK